MAIKNSYLTLTKDRTVQLLNFIILSQTPKLFVDVATRYFSLRVKVTRFESKFLLNLAILLLQCKFTSNPVEFDGSAPAVQIHTRHSLCVVK